MKQIMQQLWTASAAIRRKDGDWEVRIHGQTEVAGLLIVAGPRSQEQAQQIADLAAAAPAMADLLAECVPGGLSEVRFSEWKEEVLRVFKIAGIADSLDKLIARRLTKGELR